ncbi:MAG: FG-GAP repeat protein [Chloroflexi bacterium]|nr:FG-GAP repeat protein [Chloroflexota bacterium]
MKLSGRLGAVGLLAGLFCLLVMTGWQNAAGLFVPLPAPPVVANSAANPDGLLVVDAFVLTPHADWTSFIPQDANYGFSLNTAGDVNGDGFADVIIGANWFDGGEVDEGAVFVFSGGPDGLQLPFSWRVESNNENEELGIAVAAAGDVNGDGFADVIIGANSPLPNVGGKAYLFLGSLTGLSLTPDWVVAGEQLDDLFGTAVAAAGDVNGDGYDDVIVGAPNYRSGAVPLGRAYVYYGGPDGLSPSPDWIAESDLPLARFGVAVGTAGDVNGDGYDDVVIGASEYAPDGETGMAAVFLGSVSGLPAGLPVATPADAISVVYGSYTIGSQFGFSAGAAGDVNDDGFADVIVGAPGYGDQLVVYGAAFLYYGTELGLDFSPTFLSEYRPDSMFGRVVGMAGDVNNDGYDDVIIGAPGYEVALRDGPDRGPTAVGGGGAFVYLGSSAGVDSAPVWSGGSLVVDARYGTAAATAGDVNGDGFADLLVGAPLLPNPAGFTGQAFAYYGSGLIPSLTAVNSSPTAVGQPTFFQALAPAAGFLQYEWAFGDGGTAVGQNVTHDYNVPGAYTAVVTATSLTHILTATTPVTITVDAAITPGDGGELIFTNPQTGLGLRVNVPPGAVAELIKLAYTPLAMIPQPSPTNTIRYYFDLDAVAPERLYLPLVVKDAGDGGTAVLPTNLPFSPAASYPFLLPVSVTIFYNETTLPPGTDENAMQLQFWDKASQTWIDAATTCIPTSTYTYNPAENWFRVDICHLTRFAVVGG